MFDRKEFKLEHLDQMDMRQFETKRLNRDQLEIVAQRGVSQTFYINEQIILVAGFYHIFAKVVEVYIVPSIHMHVYPVTVIRELRRFLESLEQTPIHRIQTLALADPLMDKWMRTLGFNCEGTFAQYTDDGLDFRMWSRVRQR